jgi:hypothetical protein
MSKIVDRTGVVFGYLTVIQKSRNSNKGAIWLCKCVCGALKEIRGDHLKSGGIDNDKGYSPENCKWSTAIEQANNKTTTSMVLFKK